MNARRLYVPVVLGLLAAGGLAFLAASRTWRSAEVVADGLPASTVAVTGTDSQPLVSALALIVVTGALAVLAASVRVRRVVGALVVVVSVVGFAAIVFDGAAVDSALRSAVEESPSFTGANRPTTTDETLWHAGAAAALLLAAVLGSLVVRFSGRWPTMGSRYDAPAAHRVAERPETEADIWKALDEGRDPTQ